MGLLRQGVNLECVVDSKQENPFHGGSPHGREAMLMTLFADDQVKPVRCILLLFQDSSFIFYQSHNCFMLLSCFMEVY